jgi:hypothetical protein
LEFFIEDMSNFSVLTIQYYHSDPHFISFRRFTHCRTPRSFLFTPCSLFTDNFSHNLCNLGFSRPAQQSTLHFFLCEKRMLFSCYRPFSLFHISGHPFSRKQICLLQKKTTDDTMTMCPRPICPRTFVFNGVSLFSSLARCVPDPCIPILDCIQALHNHNSYWQKPSLSHLNRRIESIIYAWPPASIVPT